MGTVMNMSSYEIEQNEIPSAEYGEEVLYSGWNPAVALMCQQYASVGTEQPMAIPCSLAAADTDTFLEKMYAFQR